MQQKITALEKQLAEDAKTILTLQEHLCHEECGALKESEKRYNIIVENANEAIMVFQNGLIKFFNQKALDIGGYVAEDYQDQPFVNFVPTDYQEILMERHRRRMAGEDVPNFYLTKILHKGGEELWLQMNAI
jgi:PAS domain S-box-containing protein